MRVARVRMIALGCVVGVGVIAAMPLHLMATDTVGRAATRSTRRASGDPAGPSLREKLETIQANQLEILKRVEEVLVEIGYAKTRAILR